MQAGETSVSNIILYSSYSVIKVYYIMSEWIDDSVCVSVEKINFEVFKTLWL